LEGDLAQRYDHPNLPQKDHLLGKIGTTVLDFLLLGPVLRRCAPNRGSYETVSESQPVFPLDGLGLRGESKAMQGTDKPIAGTIAREHSSSSVASMGCGGETDDEELSHRITETGKGPAPIVPASVPRRFLTGHLLAVFHKSWTLAAPDDTIGKQSQLHCRAVHSPHIVPSRIALRGGGVGIKGNYSTDSVGITERRRGPS